MKQPKENSRPQPLTDWEVETVVGTLTKAKSQQDAYWLAVADGIRELNARAREARLRNPPEAA